MKNFKDSVVYQIYIKSFQDSNGDGIGDLKGITSRLSYLQSLGIDYLWITPFFVSPQNDNGYDVANYTEIDPLFGTMNDVEELIETAEKKNIGIVLDMVFNHTSTQHQWFQKALQGDKKYMNYYIFKDGDENTPPTNWESKFGGNAWEYVPHLKKWYLHLFDVTQADLNWDNKDVRDELKKVILFWKNKGVKGFRFDVVNLISKPEKFENDFDGDGRRFYTDGRNVHNYLKELVKDTGIKDFLTVGEMSSTTLENCIKYSSEKEEELSMVFNFHHLKIDYKNKNKWEIMKPDYKEFKDLLIDWQIGMEEHNGWNALFFNNHDQPRMVSRLGDDKKYWFESATMLATITHLMRGTPYIYQGEEIGMTNSYFKNIEIYKDVESINYYNILLNQGKTKQEAIEILNARSRDNSRTPMQWNDGVNAGFTTGETWLSVCDNYKEINVDSQVEDEKSIFHYYRRLINLRKNNIAISEGTFKPHLKENLNVFVFSRELCYNKIIVICNLVGENIEIELPEDYSENVQCILSNQESFIFNKIYNLKPFETFILIKE